MNPSDQLERQDIELEIAAEATVSSSCVTVEQDVIGFLSRGCGCEKCDHGPCSAMLTGQEVTSYRLSMAEWERTELDMVVLSQLRAGMNADQLLSNTRGAARPDARERVTFTYMFKGRQSYLS